MNTVLFVNATIGFSKNLFLVLSMYVHLIIIQNINEYRSLEFYEFLDSVKVDSVNSISALDHVRELKLSSILHLTSVDKLLQSCYTWVILRKVGEVHIFKYRLYILEQAGVLILGKYVILGVINTIDKHCHIEFYITSSNKHFLPKSILLACLNFNLKLEILTKSTNESNANHLKSIFNKINLSFRACLSSSSEK